MKIVSLFAGCGGLDLGFKLAGFDIIWANEFDKSIWKTYQYNHKDVFLNKNSIVDIKSSEIPDSDGIIGGPPCQPWSLAGALRGLQDERGAVINEYIRVIRDKRPLFFLFENVPGIVSKRHIKTFMRFMETFELLGYKTNFKVVNAYEYGVPQVRRRVIVVGYRNDVKASFSFPLPVYERKNLRDAIGNMPPSLPAMEKNKPNAPENLYLPNHEHFVGSFSTIYMSRNRKRRWDEPSFTIQASGRHAPLHPSSPDMIFVSNDKWKFQEGKEHLYRRLSIREAARIQTFPDDFIFFYDNLAEGYKMVGNAVPILLAKTLAESIIDSIENGVLKGSFPRNEAK